MAIVFILERINKITRMATTHVSELMRNYLADMTTTSHSNELNPHNDTNFGCMCVANGMPDYTTHPLTNVFAHVFNFVPILKFRQQALIGLRLAKKHIKNFTSFRFLCSTPLKIHGRIPLNTMRTPGYRERTAFFNPTAMNRTRLCVFYSLLFM